MIDIVLASGSPAKRKLLEEAGFKFRFEESGFKESFTSTDPEEVVKYLAREKARAVAQKYPSAAVIGADTIIFHENKIIGKPKDEADARNMLRSYSGVAHVAYTGIAVVYEGREVVAVSSVKVLFRKLTEQQIDAYIATGEPFGKAGAYAYQLRGATLIEKMEGDERAALGMPLFKLCTLLESVGINPLTQERL